MVSQVAVRLKTTLPVAFHLVEVQVPVSLATKRIHTAPHEDAKNINNFSTKNGVYPQWQMFSSKSVFDYNFLWIRRRNYARACLATHLVAK